MSRRDRMLRRQPAKSSSLLKRLEKTPDVEEGEQQTNSETTDTESTQTNIQLNNGGSETRRYFVVRFILKFVECKQEYFMLCF